MFEIFDIIKDDIPLKNNLKERNNQEFVIISNEDLDVFYLNETAKFIWENCDGDSSIEEIYLRIMKEYDVESAVLKNDIIEVIRDLQWKKLILIRSISKNESI